MADNTSTERKTNAQVSQEMEDAALRNFRRGKGKASDLAVIQATRPDIFEQMKNYVSGSKKAAYDYTTTKGATRTSAEQDSDSTATQKGTSSTTSSSTSSNRIPGIEYDENGAATKASLDALNKHAADMLTSAYSLSDAIGANRKKVAEERARQEEMLRKKQKMNELVESGRIISDIISAGAGGNVYKRDKQPDETDDKILRLRELQAAEDAANAQSDYQSQIELAKAILGVEQQNREMLSSKVQSGTSNTNTSSDSTNKTHTKSKQTTDPVSTSVAYDKNKENKSGGSNKSEQKDPRTGTGYRGLGGRNGHDDSE